MSPRSRTARRVQARRARADAARQTISRRRRIRTGTWVAAAVVAVATVAWAVIAANSAPARSSGPSAVTAHDQVLGKASAPVTVVQYGDFKCPFCTRFFEQTEPRLRHTYVDTGKVRLVWRDFPNIDDESRTAAVAAWCAGAQGRFWQYHDALYQFVGNNFYGKGTNVEGQPAYQGHYLGLARQAGALDEDTFQACLDSGKARQEVDHDRQQGATQGVTGTPTFFINGHKVVGAQPFDVFAQLIDQQLARS